MPSDFAPAHMNSAGDNFHTQGLTRTLYTGQLLDEAVLRRAETTVPAEWNVSEVILDLYEIIETLGQGGAGQVYKVRHRGWNTELAVKTPLHETLITAGGKENFIREASTWVDIGMHPHIVTCYYTRLLGGIPRVFAEYISGGSLAEWIRERRLYEGGPEAAIERILDIAIQITWGLQFAHQYGLVHQDVKPSNVMMTSEGIAKVTDFGGGITQAYCSPEHISKQPLTLKADIWSWGASVFEMFTGEVTWMAGQAVGHALSEYSRGSHETDYIPRMPVALINLLRQCFQVGPDARPRDMGEVIENLLAIYHETTGKTYARQQPRAGQGTAATLNNRALSFLDLGKDREAEAAWKQALTLDLKHPETVFNLGMWQWRRGLISDAAFVQQLESVRTVHAGDWTDEYLLALFHLERGDIEAALPLLKEAARRAPESPEIEMALKLARGNSITNNQPQRIFDSGLGIVRAGQFNSAAQHVIAGNSIGKACVWHTDSDDPYRTFWNDGPVDFLSMSNNGRALIGRGSNRAGLWDVETGHLLRSFQLKEWEQLLLWWLREPDPDSKKGQIWRSIKFQFTLRVLLFPLIGLIFTILSFIYAFVGLVGVLIFLLITTSSVALYFKAQKWTREWFLEKKAHLKFVNIACLSGDGKHALSWCEHKGMNFELLRYWNVETGENTHTLEEHSGSATSFRSYPEGWLEGTAGSVIQTLVGRTWFDFGFKSAPPETLNVLAEKNKKTKNVVISLCLCDEESLALTGSTDANARIYDIKVGRMLHTLKGHSAPVSTVCLSRDGRLAMTGSGDNTVALWDTKNGQRLKTFLGHTDSITCLAFNSDATYALSGSLDHSLRLWEISSGRCLRTYKGHPTSPVSVSFNQLGDTALSLDRSRGLYVWSVPQQDVELFPLQISRVSTTEEIISTEGRVDDLLHRGEEAIHEASFDEALLLVQEARRVPGFERMQQGLAEWEKLSLYCQRAGLRATWPAMTLAEHTSEVACMCLSYDGRYLLIGNAADNFSESKNSTLRLWDIYEGCCIHEFKYSESIHAVCMDEAGHHSLSGGPDGNLILWDLKKGRYERTLWGHEGAVTGVAITSDGRFGLSCAEDRTLRLWDMKTGFCLWTSGFLGRSSAICIDPTDRYILIGMLDGSLRLFDIASGTCVLTLLEHRGAVNSVGFTSDGQRAFSGSDDGTVLLWDLQSGECLRELSDSGNPVQSVCGSGDSRYVVVGNIDGTLRLWELATGCCMHTFIGHTQKVNAVAMVPNGRYAISGSDDKTLRLWEIDWELLAHERAEWDEGARPYLVNFLNMHMPPKGELPIFRQPSLREVRRALTHTGKPSWSEQDVEALMSQLQYAGYGWLSREGVTGKLHELSDNWQGCEAAQRMKARGPDRVSGWLGQRLYPIWHVIKPSRSPITLVALIVGLPLIIIILYATSMSGPTRSPETSYRPTYYNTSLPYNVTPPKIVPTWQRYTPGGHSLSLELTAPPELVSDTILPVNRTFLQQQEFYICRPSTDIFITFHYFAFKKGIKITPVQVLFADLKQQLLKEKAKDVKLYARSDGKGGLRVNGVYTLNNQIKLVDGLIRAKDSEIWMVLTQLDLTPESLKSRESDSALKRIIDSIEF